MQTQYIVLAYRFDLYFHKHKLAIDVDELGHVDKILSNEIERQKVLEKEINCMFIRVNPERKNQHFQRNKQDTQAHWKIN